MAGPREDPHNFLLTSSSINQQEGFSFPLGNDPLYAELKRITTIVRRAKCAEKREEKLFSLYSSTTFCSFRSYNDGMYVRRLDFRFSDIHAWISWPEAVRLVSKFYICFWHSPRVDWQYSKIVRVRCLSTSRCSRNHFSVFSGWRSWLVCDFRLLKEGNKMGREKNKDKEKKGKW